MKIEPTLFIMVGMPASGKSTYLQQIGAYHILSTDNYIENVAAEFGISYNQAFEDNIGEATSQMLDKAQELSKTDNDVYWDQTNLSRKARAKKMRYFPNYDKVALVFNNVDPVTYITRLNSRPGKTIPMNVLTSMAQSYEEPSITEGFSRVINIV